MEADVAIVGAGPNGLAAASILSRSGLRVVVVERNPWPGGLAGGSPGVADSLFAYAIGLVPREVDKLLGLGLSSLLHEPDPSWVELGEDGEILFRWWRSPDRLAEEAREAGIPGLVPLLRLVRAFWRCYKARGLYYTWEPPSPDRAAQELEDCGEPEAARLVEERASRILGEHLPLWAWGLLLYPSMYRSNGFSLAYYLQNGNVWGLPLAGMRLVAWRLLELAKSSGATVLLGEPVRDVLVERGRVAGVQLGGRSVRARAVLYTPPVYTLPRLPGAAGLLEEWEIRSLRRMAGLKLDVVRVDYYVRRRPSPPREPGWRGHPIIVYWTRYGGGEYSYPSLYGGNPVLVQGSGGIQNPLRPLPPGVDEDDIVLWTVRGRHEQERCCWNTTGHPDHVPMIDPYIMDRRPLPGWGDYRTSAPGLYHGSASSYPGGEVSLVPGVNAALRILVDLGLEDEARRLAETLAREGAGQQD